MWGMWRCGGKGERGEVPKSSKLATISSPRPLEGNRTGFLLKQSTKSNQSINQPASQPDRTEEKAKAAVGSLSNLIASEPLQSRRAQAGRRAQPSNLVSKCRGQRFPSSTWPGTFVEKWPFPSSSTQESSPHLLPSQCRDVHRSATPTPTPRIPPSD